MLLVLGLILLIAAVVVGVAGVLTNDGAAHQLTGGFSVFDYHVTGWALAYLSSSGGRCRARTASAAGGSIRSSTDQH
ncbi:hypothetical protein [Streptomyces sp. NBC_00503]|uniref:hypothetical protein n=1 Tax=Streptomyces sp. NBC_00503 TaxID=2903659 RepID=UPI002E813ABD|nr:hypothetical protein [Streptomyces sp. NBC_00503]WUD79755.1 hypothetical protein OG490_03740 [Streptomyces sp. NBC_00503]